MGVGRERERNRTYHKILHATGPWSPRFRSQGLRSQPRPRSKSPLTRSQTLNDKISWQKAIFMIASFDRPQLPEVISPFLSQIYAMGNK